MAAGAVSVPQIVPLNLVPGITRRNTIDSGTKLEISTDTYGARIYFTIDGSRPGESSKNTRTYKHPFSLQPGKYTIRAVAVTSDGRESAVASRSFTVYGAREPYMEGKGFRVGETSRNDGLDFVEDISARSAVRNGHFKRDKETLAKSLHSAWSEEQSERQSKFFEPVRLSTGISNNYPDRQSEVSQDNQDILSNSNMNNLYTCARCGLRLPAGVSRCVVCECDSILVTALPNNGIQPGITLSRPHTSEIPANPKPCFRCGAINSPTSVHCMSCNNNLFGDVMGQTGRGSIAPTIPTANNSLTVTQYTTGAQIRCNNCTRVNDAAANFCDWCSSPLSSSAKQPGQPLCVKCGSPTISPNRPCFTCGTISNSASKGNNNVPLDTRGIEVANPLLPNNDPFFNRTEYASKSQSENYGFKVNKSSQTIQSGSFVPSTNGNYANVTPRKGSEGWLATSLSPGRGYWRQQLKHIGHQLESFASSSADFRASIGPHQLGRLLAARVTNSGGDEFVVRLVFNLPSSHNQKAYYASRDTTNRGIPSSRDNGNALFSGRSGMIDGSSNFVPRKSKGYDYSTIRTTNKRPGVTSHLGRRAYGKDRYSDTDDYVSSDRQVNRYVERLDIEEHSTIIDDDDFITGSSEEETTDRDVLDTFREEDQSTKSRLIYGSKKRTRHNFHVSTTPRRTGRSFAGSVSSKASSHHNQKKKPLSAFEQSMKNKPSILALKELSVDGSGRVEVLRRLFSEDNVDCGLKSRDGWSLAHFAVINRHPDTIPVIAQYSKSKEDVLSLRGPSASYGNTPLHEAVRLSTSSGAALQALELLLKCGADVQKTNDRGETPFEYAQKLGRADAGKKIAASLGQRRLQAAGLVADNQAVQND